MSTETAKHRELGLTDSEFELIVEKMDASQTSARPTEPETKKKKTKNKNKRTNVPQKKKKKKKLMN